jgi:HK97 family phage prohead protease
MACPPSWYAATLYGKVIWHDREIKVVMRGAFAKCINSGANIKFLLNHDHGKVVGSTQDGLELHADEYGVGFRFPLPDTPLGREARHLASSGTYECMSIGFDDMRQEYKEIEGEKVLVLHDGRLNEISLVGRGAIANAYAQLVPAESCGPTLRGDCLQMPMQLLSNGAYVKLMKSMRALRDAL